MKTTTSKEKTEKEKAAAREIMLIQAEICARFEKHSKKEKLKCPDRLHLMMDLHYADKDTPLDWQKLLKAPLFDFLHDMYGIERHLNKCTLKMENCFLPRCAKPEKKAA